MSEHAPRQTDSLTRIAVYPLAAAGFVAAYAAGVATIRAGYSQMERSMADTLLAQDDPFSRVAIAAAVFAALGAAHVATDIVRGQPTRGIGVLCLPMLLVAAFVPSSDALVLAVAATMALVAGRRLIENADLPRPVAPRAWPRSLRFLYVPALIALVLLAVSVCRVPARFWVAPAVFALFAIVSALSLGPRGRALLAVEGIVAFVPLTGGIVYALMPRAAELPEATAPATFLALAGMAHVMAIRRHDAFRAPNLAIGAMIVISLAGVEWAHVAPGGSAEPMREGGVSFLPGTRYLGKVIPAGFLDGMATPWYVELGRIRPGPPPYEKPGGTVRVIALGSSSTEGWGIDDYRRVWPALLEAHLRKAYATRAIDVLNAGAAGSTTFRMMLNLKHELVRFAPDLVVLYAGNNDATIAFGPYTDRDLFELAQEVGVEPRMLVQIDPRISMENTGRRPVDAATRLRARLSRLALYRAMRSAVVDVRELAVSTENRDSMQVRAVPPDEVFPILLQMLKACQKHAADFVIVAEATHNLSIEPYPTLMEAFAERHGVPFFRAADAMGACAPDAGELFQDEVHLTHAGNVCLARAVADFLVARGLPNSAAARISAASRASPVPTR